MNFTADQGCTLKEKFLFIKIAWHFHFAFICIRFLPFPCLVMSLFSIFLSSICSLYLFHICFAGWESMM